MGARQKGQTDGHGQEQTQHGPGCEVLGRPRMRVSTREMRGMGKVWAQGQGAGGSEKNPQPTLSTA